MNVIKEKFDEVNDTCRFCIYSEPFIGSTHVIYNCRISNKKIMETKYDMFFIATWDRGDTLDLETCYRCTYYKKGEPDEKVVESHMCCLRDRHIWKRGDNDYIVATRTDKIRCSDRIVRTINVDDESVYINKRVSVVDIDNSVVNGCVIGIESNDSKETFILHSNNEFHMISSENIKWINIIDDSINEETRILCNLLEKLIPDDED